MPLEAVDDPVVHPAEPDGHDLVRAVDRPAPAIRCDFLDGQGRVSSPDQVLEPGERGLPPRAVRNHLFQGILKPLEQVEDVEHEGRPHAREDLSHRTLDPLRPVGQDHDLFAVESATALRLVPEAVRELRHPTARGLRAVDCGGLRDAARDGPDPSLPVARDLADAQELRLPRHIPGRDAAAADIAALDPIFKDSVRVLADHQAMPASLRLRRAP